MENDKTWQEQYEVIEGFELSYVLIMPDGTQQPHYIKLEERK